MRRDAAWLLLGAFVLRLLVGLVAIGPPAWDGVIYDRAARQLAEGEGYTQRMIDPARRARATAFYPVGFPATLAAVYRVLGPGALAVVLLQSLAGSAAVVLGYVLARRLASRRRALAASWLHALAPGPVLMGATYLSEPVAAAALAAALAALAWPGALRGRRGWRATAAHGAAGLLGGLAALVRPTALLAVGLASAVAPLLGRARWRRLAALGVTLAGVALALAPWAARNARELRAPVLVSSNEGVNLLIGTLEGGGRFAPVPRALDCPRPGREVHGAEREIVFDRCRRDRALARIAQDPLAWVARSLPKLLHTFGYEASPALASLAAPRLPLPRGSAELPTARLPAEVLALVALSTLVWWLALALAVRGTLRLLRAGGPRRRLALALVLAAAAFAVTHAVFLGGDRYHQPLWPLVATLAAAGLPALRRPRPGSEPGLEEGRPRAA